jgi:hypothetical protein
MHEYMEVICRHQRVRPAFVTIAGCRQPLRSEHACTHSAGTYTHTIAQCVASITALAGLALGLPPAIHVCWSVQFSSYPLLTLGVQLSTRSGARAFMVTMYYVCLALLICMHMQMHRYIPCHVLPGAN